MIKVFVYGTLKRGYGNHRLLAGRSIFIGDDSIAGKLFDLGPFPAAQKGEGKIYGEVWMIGPHTLKSLDTLEGHPEFYKREPVTTQAGHEAWVYFMPELHCTKREHYLPEGRWPRKAA